MKFKDSDKLEDVKKSHIGYYLLKKERTSEEVRPLKGKMKKIFT